MKLYNLLLQKRNIYILASFITGFSLMTIELVASRIVAPMIGSSIFTWTSIIGVILLGLAVGSFVGGRVADGYSHKAILPLAFIFSGLSVILINYFAKDISWFNNNSSSITIVALTLSTYLFLLPSILIGTIQPIILKKYSHNFNKIGSEYGLLSAVWSLGSILGVFLTGFFLISFLGSSETIYLVSIVLLLLGLLFSVLEKNIDLLYTSVVMIIVILLFFYVPQSKNNIIIYEEETPYYKARIVDFSVLGGGNTRSFLLDTDSHSLESENVMPDYYTEIYPAFKLFNNKINNILVIGAGAYILPKHLASFYPKSIVNVLEIDPRVVYIAEKYFPFDDEKIKTEIGDARRLLSTDAQVKYDLIFGDAYNSYISVPGHLLTVEWNEIIKDHLNDSGVYAINFISSVEGKNSLLFNSVLNTFKKTFPNYYVFAWSSNTESIQNITILGINNDVTKDITTLKEELGMGTNSFLANWLITDPVEYLDDEAVILTDNFYPVERLMLPVIKEYFPKNLLFLKQLGL